MLYGRRDAPRSDGLRDLDFKTLHFSTGLDRTLSEPHATGERPVRIALTECPLMTPSGILPTPLSMVVCDYVWWDSSTKKYTLLGTFTRLRGETFPMQQHNFGIYLALTDGHGPTELRLQLIDVNLERDPVFETSGCVNFEDPRMVVQVGFNIGDISYPAAGEYRLQLFANTDDLLLERRVEVTARNP
jgi:hypothetical protein